MEIVTIPDSDDDELNLLSSLTEARVSQIEEDWTVFMMRFAGKLSKMLLIR